MMVVGNMTPAVAVYILSSAILEMTTAFVSLCLRVLVFKTFKTQRHEGTKALRHGSISRFLLSSKGISSAHAPR
jgi:hypothetical protein